MTDKEVLEDLQDIPEESEDKEDASPSEETTQESAEKDKSQEGEVEPTLALNDDEFLQFLEGKKDVDTRTTDADTAGRGSESSGTTKSGKPDRDRNPDGTYRASSERPGTHPGFQKQARSKAESESGESQGEQTAQSGKSPEGRMDLHEQKKGPIDYKEVYESIFKPFKANGKDITPRDTKDVISLMQMGANYTKKMQEIAPLRKVVESLSMAGIKKDEDISFLIDLHKGEKEAIKKLLKDHNIDPISDLDMDETNYVAHTKNLARDRDIEWNETYEDIKDSLGKISEVMDKWDRNSKEFLLSDPKNMRALHDEIQMDRFDKVQSMVELEKTFGRYRGVPDIEIYFEMLNRLNSGKTQKPTDTPDVKRNLTPKRIIPDKKEAAPVRIKGTSSTAAVSKSEMASMSDDEFMKLVV